MQSFSSTSFKRFLAAMLSSGKNSTLFSNRLVAKKSIYTRYIAVTRYQSCECAHWCVF